MSFNMEMDINFYTVIVSIVGAFFGGWISSFFQMKRWKQSEKLSFMWNFRLKIIESEKLMWDTESYTELNVPLNWLIVASQDPRVDVEVRYAENYSKAVIAAWKYQMEQIEHGVEITGISTKLLKEVESTKLELDAVILGRIKKLKI